MRIALCEFRTEPAAPGRDMGSPKQHVWVTYDDGKEEDLFSFYTDELTFSPSEFVGLTREEALKLRRRRYIDI